MSVALAMSAKRPRTSKSEIEDDIDTEKFFLTAVEGQRTKVVAQLSSSEEEFAALEIIQTNLLQSLDAKEKELAIATKALRAAKDEFAATKAQQATAWQHLHGQCEIEMKDNKAAIYQMWNGHQKAMQAENDTHRQKINDEREKHERQISVYTQRLARLQIDLKGSESLLKMAHEDLKRVHNETKDVAAQRKQA